MANSRIRLQQQMTLDVGKLGDDELPIVGSFSVSGKLRAIEELPSRADVIVTVTNADGVVVAYGSGKVGTISFKACDKDGVQWRERRHAIKIRDGK